MTFTLKIKPTEKQKIAWERLRDKETQFILYGGAAGTGKSWLGSEFLISHSIAYPETKWFIGRNELKRIMRSTYITFEKACKFHNIPSTCWKLDSKYNFIKFWNGSRIELLDLSYQPRDPLYERFGSEEYTGGWIEEAGEVKEKAFDVLKSRIGRQHNDYYGLYPKMLLTCNPKKNWLYFLFYNPWRQGELSKDSVFIPALYYDNPFTSDQYGEMLSKIRDPIMRARLKDGKWEYDDEEGAMMSYNQILEIFNKEPVFSPEDERFLSVDVARFGRDNSVFILWQGYHIERIWEYDKSSTVFVEDKIRSICNQYKMDYRNVVVDSDGVGGGVVDHLPGVYAFVNGGRPITEYDDDKKYRDQETDRFFYANLRAQCYDRLSTYVNEGIVSCNPDINTETRNMIIQELEVIKKKDVEKNEKKVQVIPKEEIKDTIGRSPDYGDAIMQRMVFGLGDPRETMEDQGEIAVVW